jgi:S1-C subfamily serine protease
VIPASGFDLEVGGDVITAIDGKVILNMDDLITYLITDYQPGDEVEMAIIHADGSEETITVTLGKRPTAEELLGLQDELELEDQE